MIALFLVVLTIVLVRSVEAQSACPAGYFQYGDFCCNSDPKLEQPNSAFGRKFCQPQITGCQVSGGSFCSAGSRNICCSTNQSCGLGTIYGAEVALCVSPLPPVGGSTSICSPKSSGYIGRTKDGQNVCCGANEEARPAASLASILLIASRKERRRAPPASNLSRAPAIIRLKKNVVRLIPFLLITPTVCLSAPN